MSNRFANGAKAIAECDVCGFRFKLKELKNLVVKTKQVSIKACRQCWTPDQPQLLLGTFPVEDPQALRDPRPDRAGYYGTGGSRIFEWGWAPVGGSRLFDAPLTPNALSARGVVGTVVVV
jgi:hypothetical protein